MAFLLEDRVLETSTTTGTGTFDLDGAPTGYRTFISAIGNSNSTYYCIVNRAANEWEVGIGTVTSGSPNTLARALVLRSTNSNAAVNFSAGTKDVFVTYPATRSVSQFGDAELVNLSITNAGALTVNGVFSIRDGSFSHQMYIMCSGSFTSNRQLSFALGDANRTITLSGNPTLADWFNQNVKSTASPVFVGATFNQGVVINETGADADTRIEGDTDQNLVFTDASTDRVGIGTSTPISKLDVAGQMAFRPGSSSGKAKAGGRLVGLPDFFGYEDPGSSSSEALGVYTVPASLFATDGDTLDLFTSFKFESNGATDAQVDLSFAGNTIASVVFGTFPAALFVHLRIMRSGSSQALIHTWWTSSIPDVSSNKFSYSSGTLTSLNFASTLAFEAFGITDATETTYQDMIDAFFYPV